MRPAWFWKHPLQGASLGAFLRQPRRDLAFPGAIDRALAARGKQLFADNCARCHGDYADDGHVIRYDEQVVPLDVVGTDPARAHAPTDDFLAAANDPKLTQGLTHAKRTMEAADCLYGVSMPPGGSSRVVSQRVNDDVPVA